MDRKQTALFSAFILFTQPAFADEGITPGGLVYAQSFWGDQARSLSENRMRITVHQDPGAASSYFWAQQFFYPGKNEGGYIGLQTGGTQKGRNAGKQFIFSVWNIKEADPGKGAVCEPFGGEGNGMKCSLIYDWKEGREYTVTVAIAENRLVGTVQESGTRNFFLIGTMPMPRGSDSLSHGSLIWIEYFGVTRNCEEMPAQSATFAPLPSNQYRGRISNITYGKVCTNSRASATNDGTAVRFTTGGQTDRTSRHQPRLKTAAYRFCGRITTKRQPCPGAE